MVDDGLVDIGFWIKDDNGGWFQMSVMIIGHLGKCWFGEFSVKSALPK